MPSFAVRCLFSVTASTILLINNMNIKCRTAPCMPALKNSKNGEYFSTNRTFIQQLVDFIEILKCFRNFRPTLHLYEGCLNKLCLIHAKYKEVCMYFVKTWRRVLVLDNHFAKFLQDFNKMEFQIIYVKYL